MKRVEEPELEGYVSAKKAADMLGLSKPRIHKLADRLEAKRISNVLLYPIKNIENYKRNPTGRIRKNPPKWRIYRGDGNVLTTEITIPIKAGQRERLQEKLKGLLKEQDHTLTGSMARYVLAPDDHPDLVKIWLVWRDVEMPDEVTHQAEMDELREELADVLDWERAHYEQASGMLYT
jgi:hypothetical protein